MVGFPEDGGPDGPAADGVAERAAAAPDVGAAWTRMHERLVRAAQNVLRDGHDAEDVAQEAYLAAVGGAASLRDPGRVEAWLMRITKNIAVSHRRRRMRCRPDSRISSPVATDGLLRDAPIDEVRAPDPPPDAVRSVQEALDDLPEPLRRTYVARVLEGRDWTDIAAEQGVTPSCVRTRVSRTWRRLRDAL